MFRKINDKLKNKKGLGSIEIVISGLIVLLMVAGLIDMINITQRLDATSQTTGYVARVVQKQGGVQPTRIANYNGKYISTPSLYNNVKGMMDVNGVAEEDWTIKLVTNGNTYVIQEDTRIPLVDYGNRITVTIETKFRWNILSTMFPGVITSGGKSDRVVLSAYQIRTDSGMETDLEL